MMDTLMLVDSLHGSCPPSPTVSSGANVEPRYLSQHVSDTQTVTPRHARSVYVAAASDLVDVTVLPGRAATPAAVQGLKNRKLLLEMVRRFSVHGFSQQAGVDNRITSSAAAAACALIRLLPSFVQMPKIAPDGEGSVVAIWSVPGGPLVINMDDHHLHIVAHATTENSEYYDDVPFSPDAMTLPDEVSRHLPSI